VVLALGLVVRGALILWLPADALSTDDSRTYLAFAGSLLDGHGFSTDTAEPFRPSVERPPGYPLLVALAWLIGGRRLGALSVLQLLMDLAVIAALWDLARRRFGETAATVGAGMYAVLPFTAGVSVQFMSEGAATAGVVLAAWAQTRAVQATVTARARLAWLALAGAAWGFAVLCRPYLLPVAGAAALLAAWELRRSAGLRGAALAAVVLGGASVLTVLPWPLRNAWVSAHTGVPFVLFQPYGSRLPYTRMYTPEFMAWYRSLEEPLVWLDWRKPPDAPYLTPEEKLEVSRLWEHIAAHDGEVTPAMSEAFRRITEERYRRAPLRLYVWRPVSIALKFWMSPRLSTLRLAIDEQAGLTAAPRVLLGLFLALNLSVLGLGAWGVVRRGRPPDHYFLWGPPAALTLTLTVLAHRESRLVMPVFPLVVLAAALGLLDLVRRVRQLRSAAPSMR
jgi:4-amino-4-deoxy-L-arabinose transferase-like glycosyltransferase